MRYNWVVFLFICLWAVFAFTGCVSQGEIKAEVWLNSGLPKSICDRVPEVRDYGAYRKLNDNECQKRGQNPGCVEFISYCAKEYRVWYSVSKARFEELLQKYLPADSSAQ